MVSSWSVNLIECAASSYLWGQGQTSPNSINFATSSFVLLCHSYYSYVKCKLLCIYQEKWYSEVINKPKLRFYKKFKKNYCTESYLLYNSITCIQRSYLTQLRLGILQINVEIGRYKNVTLEKRICNICDRNDVQDEIHFLFICKTYKTEHTNWFSKMDNEYRYFKNCYR